MTNETEGSHEKDVQVQQHSQRHHEHQLSPVILERRKVSISQSAIQGEAERQKRKISNCSLHRYTPSGDGSYHNPAYQQTHPHENKTSSGSYSMPNNKLTPVDKDRELSSWWYLLCLKCRQKEVTSGWQPEFWPKLCPHPFCPSYRHVARVITLLSIGMLTWGSIYFVMGKVAAPGGQLFKIAVLCLSAYVVGYIFSMATLPALLGMTLTGVAFRNLGIVQIDDSWRFVAAILRKTSLFVLLARAGLDIDPVAFQKLYMSVFTLGVLPWFVEALSVAALSHYFLSLSVMWSLYLGVTLGAVAPAVVVPCLVRLRSKGYGMAKGIPTLIIAVAGINDALSVTFFGVCHGLIFSHQSLAYGIVVGPLTIITGIGLGVVWGLLTNFIPEKGDPFVVPMRVLVLLCGGLLSLFGSEAVGLEGAGPLSVICAAFVSSWCWSKQGWSVEDNPVVTSFEVFWMICQPILFSLSGNLVLLSELEPLVVIYGSISIVLCFVLRIIATILIATGSSLNFKEKLFCALSWMSKASVQAILAPGALVSALKTKDEAEIRSSEVLFSVCMLSMLITVPIGSLSITFLGSKLLTKAKNTIPTTGWRSTARPSLRDIVIIDEEVETEQDVEQNDKNTTSENRNQTNPKILIDSTETNIK